MRLNNLLSNYTDVEKMLFEAYFEDFLDAYPNQNMVVFIPLKAIETKIQSLGRLFKKLHATATPIKFLWWYHSLWVGLSLGVMDEEAGVHVEMDKKNRWW